MYTLFGTVVTLVFIHLNHAAFLGNDLGCWKDGVDRALSGYQEMSDSMSNDQCANICRSKGFIYSGTEWRNECFCGNEYQRYGRADNCDLPCAADDTQNCGGDWALHVFDLSVGMLTDLGCWKDGWNRAVDGAELSSDAMTNDKCAQFCSSKGFRYCATEYSVECYCGNEYQKHGRADKCNLPCAGDADQNCGGEWALHVFELGLHTTIPSTVKTSPLPTTTLAKTLSVLTTFNVPVQIPVGNASITTTLTWSPTLGQNLGKTRSLIPTLGPSTPQTTPHFQRDEGVKSPIPQPVHKSTNLDPSVVPGASVKTITIQEPEPQKVTSHPPIRTPVVAAVKAPEPVHESTPLKPPEGTEAATVKTLTEEGPEPQKATSSPPSPLQAPLNAQQSCNEPTTLKLSVVPATSVQTTTMRRSEPKKTTLSPTDRLTVVAAMKAPQPDHASTTLKVSAAPAKGLVKTVQGIVPPKVTLLALLSPHVAAAVKASKPVQRPTTPSPSANPVSATVTLPIEGPVYHNTPPVQGVSPEKTHPTVPELANYKPTPAILDDSDVHILTTVPGPPPLQVAAPVVQAVIPLRSTDVPKQAAVKTTQANNTPTLAKAHKASQVPTKTLSLLTSPFQTPTQAPLLPSTVPFLAPTQAIVPPSTAAKDLAMTCVSEKAQFATNGLNIEPKFEEGSCLFVPKQCDARQCVCVRRKNGRRKRRRVIIPINHKYDCMSKVGRCYRALFQILLDDGNSAEEDNEGVVSGDYVPTCSDRGRYTPKQCDKTGTCWCVRKRSGKEIEGTRNSEGSRVQC